MNHTPHRLSGYARFDGPPRSYRIGVEPRIGWVQVAVMALVAAFIGFALAVTL